MSVAPTAEQNFSRLMRQIERADSGCWLWKGRISSNGYGQVWYDRTNRLAHRVMYTLHRGAIPAGLQLDHLCRIRHCVNPEHLEPVPPRVNTLRGATIPAANVVKTHCPVGHPYDAANTYIRKDGRRACRTCKAERQRTPQARAAWNAWYARNRKKVAS